MIRSEAQAASDVRDNAERILDQTRAITHVVTEFLKFARPLVWRTKKCPCLPCAAPD